MELDKFERKVFSAWAHITRAEDVDGCWVAYCPEFDVVSYGDSPQHAAEMIRDALEMVILDDLNNGLDPSTRRAEDAAFEPLQRLFERHEKLLDRVPGPDALLKQIDTRIELESLVQVVVLHVTETGPLNQSEVNAARPPRRDETNEDYT